MPIRHSINPELNIVFVFCEGTITGTEYFKAVQAAFDDSTDKPGVIRIVDLFSSTEDFELRNIVSAIEHTEKNAAKGIEPDHAVLLSRIPLLDV